MLSTFKNKLLFIVVFSFVNCSIAYAQIAKDSTHGLAAVDTTIFSKVDEDATFPGGQSEWARYLGNTLDSDVPVRKKAPSGNYRVIIKFAVDKDGSLTDFVAETNFGFGMEDEVIRVLKNSPHWRPASLNGQSLKAYRRQPITFNVDKR